MQPIRDLYYNPDDHVNVSVGLLADQFELKGTFRAVIGTLNDNFSNLGAFEFESVAFGMRSADGLVEAVLELVCRLTEGGNGFCGCVIIRPRQS